MSNQTNVLVVDDEFRNRDLLSKLMVSLGHTPHAVDNGLAALDFIRATPPDLILLDVMMPQMNGFQVLEKLKRDDSARHIPVIMISGLGDMEHVTRCIQGGADDYLVKPFNSTLLRARIDNCLQKKRFHDLEAEHRRQIEATNTQLERRVREQVEEISKTQLATIFAMSKLAESRDPETGEHLERMREYCRVIAQELGRRPKFSFIIDDVFVENVYAASPLHDIGKVGVPDHILQKAGKLTSDEFDIMKTHCMIGADTLRAVDQQHPGNEFLRIGIEIAESHHEKWNGAGYPHGLAGEDIPLVGRILALGDAYDALTTRRCYKEAFSHEKSRGIIVGDSGKHFDPDVVDAFLATEDEFCRIRERFQEAQQHPLLAAM